MARRKQRPRGRSTPQRPMPSGGRIPSAQTFFRYHLQNVESTEQIAQMMQQADARAWERDRESIERTERAETAGELIDLLPHVAALAGPLWQRRMRAFGPEVVPLIAARLKRARTEDQATRTEVYERLIAALRWKGDAGAAALATCFEDLDDYGKSLACVVLGLLGAQESADTMWHFYQQTRDHPRERFFVGPLWGLIDLEDARVANALAEWLWKERTFDELFGFLSLAGDSRAVVPLLLLSLVKKGDVQQQAAMALLSIAHRIGREALLVEFQKAGAQTAEQQKHREAMADDIMAASPRQAEEYFAIFYRPFDADDLARLDQILTNIQSLDASATPPPAASAIGRNDPCWCGSGIKYKHCHWRRDRGGQR
jgi:hypothetical protein